MMAVSSGKDLVAHLEAGLSVEEHVVVEELQLKKTISKFIVGSFVFINFIVLMLIGAIFASEPAPQI